MRIRVKIEFSEDEIRLLNLACTNEFVRNRFQDPKKASKYERLIVKLLIDDEGEDEV
jgi:hypothetical protein